MRRSAPTALRAAGVGGGTHAATGEGRADALGDLVDLAQPVDLEEQAALAVHVDEWARLADVDLLAVADLLLAVVGATLLGRAAGEPGDDLVLVGDELDDGVELLAPPLQQLLQVGDLGERARVAVEQEARLRVLLLEARGDEPVVRSSGT